MRFTSPISDTNTRGCLQLLQYQLYQIVAHILHPEALHLLPHILICKAMLLDIQSISEYCLFGDKSPPPSNFQIHIEVQTRTSLQTPLSRNPQCSL